MAHLYVLQQGSEADAPLVLLIHEDGGLITKMIMPLWRKSDAAIQTLIRDWHDYAQTVGSPVGVQDINLFWEFLQTNYGSTYAVVQRA